ncbi:MAG: PepSY-associated TM helix domain-containing protein [Planctomycetes bacterium]|nr:PepSY-associated TM helix domain-containing protein [Planctomycetota bacterium]
MSRRSGWRRAAARWTRTLHIYASLLGLLSLLFFALSGFLLHHAEWFETPSQVTEYQLTLEPNLEGLAVVKSLRAKGVTGLLGAFEEGGGRLELSFEKPGETSEVSVEVTSGLASVRKESRGSAELLGEIHTGKHTGTLGGLLVDVTAVILATLSLSGLYLWAGLPKRRKLGLAALAAAVLSGVSLVAYWS